VDAARLHSADQVRERTPNTVSKTVAVMKAFVAMGTFAFVVLGLATSAHAHKLKQVHRELSSQCYEQIEFERTKFPVWVNACRGGERYDLHVDWYGKIKKKTRTGSCPTEATG